MQIQVLDKTLRHNATQTLKIMADKGTEDMEEPAKPLSQAQRKLIKRQQELQQWRNNSQKLRNRNVITGLAIGAFVLGMCILGVSEQQVLIARSIQLANINGHLGLFIGVNLVSEVVNVLNCAHQILCDAWTDRAHFSLWLGLTLVGKGTLACKGASRSLLR